MTDEMSVEAGPALPRRDGWVSRAMVLAAIEAAPQHSGPYGVRKSMQELEGVVATMRAPVPAGHTMIHTLLHTDRWGEILLIGKTLDLGPRDALSWAIRVAVEMAHREQRSRRLLAATFGITEAAVVEMLRAGKDRP